MIGLEYFWSVRYRKKESKYMKMHRKIRECERLLDS